MYISSGQQSNLSRRELLRILGTGSIGLGVSSVFPGCTDENVPEASVPTLRFYGTGTLDIGSRWKRVEKDLEIRVHFVDNHNDTGPVITQMVSGTAAHDYALGGLQGGAERELARAGVILPWDLSKIPSWKHVWRWAREIPYCRSGGQQYGIPTVINADSMIYLEDKVGVIDSYAAVFDEKHKGKTAMEDAWINSVIFAAIYLKENNYERIVDPGDLSEDELKRVMTFLIEKKRSGQFRTFWSGWEHGVSLLARDEVWVMTGWEPIVLALQRRGINAKYAVPKEGYEGWSNDLLLHVGAKENGLLEAAHRFADWELSGYYGCTLTEQRGYVVPSDKNIDFAVENPSECVEPDQKAIESRVQDKFKRAKGEIYWQNVRPKNYPLYEEWWSKLRAA